MRPEEKLRTMLETDERARNGGAAIGEHLDDKDFIKIIENQPLGKDFSSAVNGNFNSADENLNAVRRHLVACDSCLTEFKDFYHFFAPAETGESVADKAEINRAWQSFAPLIAENTREKTSFWARLFPKNNSNYFAAFGWGFAALLLLVTGLAIFVARQAKNENSQLAAQLENQKQDSETRLKNLEQTAQNQNLAEQEKSRLAREKDDLQKQIAALQTEIERTKRQNQANREIVSPKNQPPAISDNSLVAVNTPIYDVFPSEAVVRSGEQTANKLIVSNRAKNVVLILNAAGRADFPVYQVVLINGAGKTVWRGGGLSKDATGNFTLTISRTALTAGNYRLKLSSGAQTVAEYPITIEIGK